MSKINILNFRRKRWPFKPGWILAGIVLAGCAYIVFGGDISALQKWGKNLGFESQPKVLRILKGYATVRDGDTITINGEDIRLEGIDAFELTQTCADMPCGIQARSELVRLVAGGHVTCDDIGRDTYDRVLGLCRNAVGQDINEALVLSGHAIAYLYFTDRYKEAQAQAREARRGVWAHDFIEPYEYRRQQREGH